MGAFQRVLACTFARRCRQRRWLRPCFPSQCSRLAWFSVSGSPSSLRVLFRGISSLYFSHVTPRHAALSLILHTTSVCVLADRVHPDDRWSGSASSALRQTTA